MDRDSDTEVLLAVNMISDAFVKPNVLDQTLVRIKANTRPTEIPSQSFGMR
jgi:hypothetical protein